MTPQTDIEWSSILTVMVGLWPTRMAKFTPIEARSWRNAIGGYPAGMCSDAISWWHGNETFFPKPCEIRAILANKSKAFGVESTGSPPVPEGVTQEERERIKDGVAYLSDEEIGKVWDALVDNKTFAVATRHIVRDSFGWQVLTYKQAKLMGMFQKQEESP